MKNNTNIYDIDGTLIRNAEDNHRFTIEEAQAQINKYNEILKETDKNDPKYKIYTSYIKNLSIYMMQLYSKMSRTELNEYINKAKAAKNLNEQIKEAMEQLSNDIEDDGIASGNPENEVQGSTTVDNGDNTNEESRNDEAVERTISDIHEERPSSQSDLLVERADVNNNMDEYVQFEELTDESNIQ